MSLDGVPAPVAASAQPTGWAGWVSSFETGGHTLALLQGGRELFPRLVEVLDQARHDVWLASYIFDLEGGPADVAQALTRAAARGVQVQVLVDGFGSNGRIAALRRLWSEGPVALEVFRPLDRWAAWFQSSQLRRLHQKLCVVDGQTAFVGGINILDDHRDVQGRTHDEARLDFAVEVQGPLVEQVRRIIQALWTRSRIGHDWRDELALIAGSQEPLQRTLQLMRELRTVPPGLLRSQGRRVMDWVRRNTGAEEPSPGWTDPPGPAAQAVLVVRDNVTQRRSIERAYVQAIRRARTQVDVACAYFYPGRAFRRALASAAQRGVRVRLLLQGKPDYWLAAWAARALYLDLLRQGVHIYEYTPAHLHAKVAVVDGQWATVGSSNIDPLSLLLNLEANVAVWDPDFARTLAGRLDQAFERAVAIGPHHAPQGPRRWFFRGVVTWVSRVYLKLAGIRSRY